MIFKAISDSALRPGFLMACLVIWASLWGPLRPAHAQRAPLLMASTTSTEQSGLFAHLLPAFKA
ncbi:MAG: hypothetical protein RLZZ123_2265, partial [Pseudomonadota bacterium]